MAKKLLLALTAVVVVVGGVAAMSAYEAHIINVTAHIENALDVTPEAVAFGTVFPQEYLAKPFTVALSESFLAENRVDDVEYVIKQKVKPCPLLNGMPVDLTCVKDDNGTVTDTDDVIPHYPTGWHYQDLCKYLSKTNTEPDGTVAQNDVSHPSYYVDVLPTGPSAGDSCVAPTVDASGKLAKGVGDIVDSWMVDLKVPPVKGTVGQDWPADCSGYVLEQNDQTYGCDLWIEVTKISEKL